jgi:hypothetical protein
MRMVEVAFVILIILGAFIISSQFAVFPSPRNVFGSNLRGLALTTLEVLDAKGELSGVVFSSPSDSSWRELQSALSASLPPNIVYNLTVYDINEDSGVITYYPYHSISNSEEGLGVESEASSYLLTSPEVTYKVTPEKIGEKEGKPRTLYILNCSDANGWWITGYTGQSLASDLKGLLEPYFETTVLVNSAYELRLLLDNSPLMEGTIEGAVVINTFGEAVPIPAEYCEGGDRESDGYDSSHGSYAPYCHLLGERTREYDWTWVSIVGYPLYYVTNTETLADSENTYGIYGMERVWQAGINAFLQGIDNKGYSYDGSPITRDIGSVEFTSEARDLANYYGIYPSQNQSASRALSSSIENDYDLTKEAVMFKLKDDHIAAATFSHAGGGALTAIGLTRTPDIRIAVLDILMYYRPELYGPKFGATGTSRLVVLQLAQQGGA